ncbi:zinc-ribbon domain-containing protein [Labedella populi]|uniref:Zinc-ribbon domain-containing protein n=1 Tax=Labedella populi TaxID=2498850 RepID=A0A3S5CPA1_9MICO|nr:zinc-ribbon domain-containing protein [Labedella populi]RWZ68305.1 zinc-ribbon domain-containing protein [Labedella populi]
MILLFGTRLSSTIVAIVSFVCPFCSQNVAQRVIKLANRFTVFFVPLFPVSTRYVNECTNCGGRTAISREQADNAVAWASTRSAA